jgi:hypothetical protein
MPYRITARLNTRTGEFEIFQVDALENNQPIARHNANHEDVADEVGRLVERRPGVEEVNEEGRPDWAAVPLRQPAAEQETQTRPAAGEVEDA